MSTSCTLRTRKFMSNRLLKRRQFVSVRIVQIFPAFRGSISTFTDPPLTRKGRKERNFRPFFVWLRIAREQVHSRSVHSKSNALTDDSILFHNRFSMFFTQDARMSRRYALNFVDFFPSSGDLVTRAEFLGCVKMIHVLHLNAPSFSFSLLLASFVSLQSTSPQTCIERARLAKRRVSKTIRNSPLFLQHYSLNSEKSQPRCTTSPTRRKSRCLASERRLVAVNLLDSA